MYIFYKSYNTEMNFNKNSVVTFCWNLINFLMEKRNGIENDIKDVWIKKKLSVITVYYTGIVGLLYYLCVHSYTNIFNGKF